MMDHKDQIILVTGATRGVGRELARQLQAEGAQVISVARDPMALPPGVDGLRADLSAPGAATEIAAWVAEEHPTCCGLINNAAIMEHCLLTETPDPARIAREVQINLIAPMQLSALMMPQLATQTGAFLCNVTSGLALAPKTDAAVYSAAKAGLRAFTRALRDQARRAEMAITVSEALLPVVDTTLSRGDPARKMPPEDAARHILAGIAAHREEIDIGQVRLLRAILRTSPTLAYHVMRQR